MQPQDSSTTTSTQKNPKTIIQSDNAVWILTYHMVGHKDYLIMGVYDSLGTAQADCKTITSEWFLESPDAYPDLWKADTGHGHYILGKHRIHKAVDNG